MSNTFSRGGKKFKGGSLLLVVGPGQSRDREAPETLRASAQFAHVRSFVCRGRLRNLVADCCALGLYCVAITRQQIFKCSLQITVASIFPHVTRAPTAAFFHRDLFFSRPVCLGLIMKNRVNFVFFCSDKVISNFNVVNNIKITLASTS